jgi:hypothetical protein
MRSANGLDCDMVIVFVMKVEKKFNLKNTEALRKMSYTESERMPAILNKVGAAPSNLFYKIFFSESAIFDCANLARNFFARVSVDEKLYVIIKLVVEFSLQNFNFPMNGFKRFIKRHCHVAINVEVMPEFLQT